MNDFRPLTALAQESVAASLEPGALAIDATVGNGRDTLFLASRVAPHGRVAGFDIQPQALDTARTRLRDGGLADSVTLYPCGHQFMLDRIPRDWHGQVSTVMFNLGYLPGSDKAVTTLPTTTLQALDQSLVLLRAGGLLSLLIYRGHPGGAAEAVAVHGWLDRLGVQHRLCTHESPGPVLHLIQRSPQ